MPRGLGYASLGMDNVDLPALMEELTGIPGIAQVSPQLRVMAAQDNPLCGCGELLVTAFDPVTDFSILTRLPPGSRVDLATGEAIAGSLVSVPGGEEEFELEGYTLRLVAQLPATGTSLDRSLLVTFDTARAMFLQPQR